MTHPMTADLQAKRFPFLDVEQLALLEQQVADAEAEILAQIVTRPLPDFRAIKDEATPDDAQRVKRVLGYCDGWADQWAAENNIADQIDRMFAGKQPGLAGHILRWSKQCFGEGCYKGFKDAQEIAKEHIIDPLTARVEELERKLASAFPGTFGGIK